MIRTTFLLLAIFLLAGCNQNSTTADQETGTDQDELIALTVDEVLMAPEQYAGKEIILKGMVTHVCRHGGQKCFVKAEGSEGQLRIGVSEQIPEFKVDMEGSNVEIHGTFKLMEASDAEAMQHENAEKDHHTGDEPHAKAENASYYLEAVSVKELETTGI